HGETGSVGVSAANKLAIEFVQHKFRIGVQLGSSVNGPHQHGDHHSGLQTFSSHVARNNQHAVVGRVGHNLEKVSADLARRAVLAFNGKSGDPGKGSWENDLLHLLRL